MPARRPPFPCGRSRSVVGDLPDAGRGGARDDWIEMSHAATVLVVEDERKIRDLVRGYLEREGLGVLTTESGAEAIALARRVRARSRRPRPAPPRRPGRGGGARGALVLDRVRSSC